MAITETSFDGMIRSDEEMLYEFQEALVAVSQAGQAYTLFGSRTVTHADLAMLERQEEKYRRRVMAANGYNGRNTAQTIDAEESGPNY